MLPRPRDLYGNRKQSEKANHFNEVLTRHLSTFTMPDITLRDKNIRRANWQLRL